MLAVTITAEARDQLEATPLPIQQRIAEVFQRLERWPAVSGAKPLKGNLKGNFRIRTGDYRVVFRVTGETVNVWKIGYRGDVYD
ncbi:MAG TPA: type II toxin-antitoxin system RelE/ParE family toxin [Phycisphaerae bacterium]|nr:type II toxin-antitoxin system RelE/ParE family toxin [Phycisphaerae bacterium]